MFRGEYQHSIDPKGRVIMPSKLREGLGENFIVTKGFDGCLFVYSTDGWSKFEAGLNALPQANPDARAIVRFFFAGAVECEVDKQGRIVIPQNLRDYAKINGDVYIIGASGRVEIWNKEKWEEYSGNISADPNALAKNLTEMGICF